MTCTDQPTATAPKAATLTKRAIARAYPKFSTPAALPQMGRKQFDCYLHDLFGKPADDAWKQPFDRDELENDPDFYLIEYFDTPKGRLMAAHVCDEYLDAVIVVMDRGTA